MECTRQQLSRPTEQGIYNAIAAVAHKLRPQEIANTIYALGLLDFMWSDVRTNNNSAANALYKAISTLHKDTSTNRHQHIANVVYGLGNMLTMWADLSADKFQLLVQNLRDNRNPQNVSLTLLGLSNMMVSWDDFNTDTRTALLNSAKHCLRTGTAQVSCVMFVLLLSFCCCCCSHIIRKRL